MYKRTKILIIFAAVAFNLINIAYADADDDMPFNDDFDGDQGGQRIEYDAEEFMQPPDEEAIQQQKFNAFACLMFTKIRFHQDKEKVDGIINQVQYSDKSIVYKKIFSDHISYCMMVIQHSEAQEFMKNLQEQKDNVDLSKYEALLAYSFEKFNDPSVDFVMTQEDEMIWNYVEKVEEQMSSQQNRNNNNNYYDDDDSDARGNEKKEIKLGGFDITEFKSPIYLLPIIGIFGGIIYYAMTHLFKEEPTANDKRKEKLKQRKESKSKDKKKDK